MKRQLQQARNWSKVVAQASSRQLLHKEVSKFGYDGWELDSPQDRPFIHDFIEHAQWFLFSIVKNHNILGLMLMRAEGHGYLPKKGIYDDRVGAARHYVGLYGADWRHHVHFCYINVITITFTSNLISLA
jgi:hypothetical protein